MKVVNISQKEKKMTNKEFQRRAVRHGEITLKPINKLPNGLEVVSTNKQAIVGHSESGHHHVVISDGSVELLRPIGADSQDLYLRVSGAARIEHLKTFDRHETKQVEPGLYYVNTKEQYDYFLKRTTRVMD